MRVKLEWLNELVDLSGISLQDIINTISLYSIEIESIEKICEATGLVTGRVVSKVAHPNSDHLSVCSVDVGDEILQIVCGAPNVEKDQIVIVALIDASLPGDFKIKKTKIRGVESSGMICSLQELGFDKKQIQERFHTGIYYFQEEVALGQNALAALKIDDVILELGLTPNRSDLLSMIGVAYDVSAAFKRPLKVLDYLVNYDPNINDSIDVVLDTADCSTYFAQVVKNVEIKDSPQWLVSRLVAFGVRPINNIVDITNYILALFGQPLHAFDFDKLGKKIVVRNACKGEQITTLDEEIQTLEEEDIAITDGEKIIALGGVMGGLDSGISNSTKNIVIEAAIFNPQSIRNTSARLGLRSESSIRFEKGVDVNRTKEALKYTCYLLEKLANASISKNTKQAGVSVVADLPIEIELDYINKYLGINLNIKEVVNIFRSLNFKTFLKSTTNIEVFVPNRRSDITIEADLIEEIARLYGYEKLPNSLPKSNLTSNLTPRQKNRRLIKNTLVGLGLNEVINYSLISSTKNKTFTYLNCPEAKEIALLMPLSEEHKYLRLNVLSGVVENVKYNFARDKKDLCFFELGKVYYQKSDITYEETHLAGAISGSFINNLWQKKEMKADFYLLKGILDHLFSKLEIEVTYKLLDKEVVELHPKRSAIILVEGKCVGYIGELHPEFSLNNDLKAVYVFELNVEEIIEKQNDVIKAKAISKIPSIERDIAVVVKKDVQAAALMDVIKKEGKGLINDVSIFDVYEINNSELSIAIKMIFTSFEILTDNIINKKIARILKILETNFDAKLRS